MQFFVTTVVPARYGMANDADWKIEWKNVGLVYHKADADDAQTEYMKFSDEKNFFDENLKENLDFCWKCTDDSLSETERLMLCGCDFSGAVSDIDKIIEKGNELVDFELKSSTIDDYIEKLRETMKEEDLVTVCGELREGPSSACSGNALSTRLYIKQLNKKVQKLLNHSNEAVTMLYAMANCMDRRKRGKKFEIS